MPDDPARKWTVTGAQGRVYGNVGAPILCAVTTDSGSIRSGAAGGAF